MPQLSEANREFRRQLSEQLRQAIGTKRGAQAGAARELGISPQRLNQYFNGTAFPKFDVLARAKKRWNLTFEYGGVEVPESAFDVKPAVVRTAPEQLDLFEAPQLVRYKDLAVKIQAQRGEGLRLTLEVRRAS